MPEAVLTHTSLKPFRQYGFNPKEKSGAKEVVGDCVFCGKSKCYINVNTQAWNCKTCSKSGGVHQFLEHTWEASKKNFKGAKAKALSEDRGLKVSTLTKAGIGYSKVSKCYIIPVMDYSGKKIHSIKKYSKGKLMATSGYTNILYNGHYLESGFSNIFLCEGEWDCLALQECLNRNTIQAKINDRTAEVAVAVPGAQTFNKDWVGMFANSNTSVLYDNDKAGKEGCVKVYNHIKPVCKLLNFYHWRETAKTGEDMRDLYKKVLYNSKRLFSRIKKNLKDLPQDTDKLDTEINQDSAPVFSYDGPFISINKIRAVFEKRLILKNPEVIDVLLATMLANRLGGMPVWLFLVGNSGCGKSEFIMSLDKVKNITAISTLTTNTLISGMETKGGGDPSLIPKLNGKVLTIKDYTTIFGMDSGDQSNISAQLRDAFDGKAAKPFGNGFFRVYESVFGIISGVTPAIESYMEGSTALGERFIRYRLPAPKTLEDERVIQRMALKNNEGENDMQEKFMDIMERALQYDYLKNGSAKIPLEFEDLLIDLALIVAHVRGSVTRDRIGQITQKANREVATRLTKQFGMVLAMLALVRGRDEVNVEDYKTLKHIAFSCMPEIRADVLEYLYSNNPDEFHTINKVTEFVRINTSGINKALEDLVLLRMVERNTIKLPATFKISSNGREMLDNVGIFKYEQRKNVKKRTGSLRKVRQQESSS